MMYRKKRFLSAILILSSFLFISQIAIAQVQSLDNLRLSNNTSMTISGELQFSQNGGDIVTAKENCNSHIGFAEGSSWSNASDDQFIDGMVKVLHDKPFTFPIGAKGQYHPIAISGAANTMAAYIAKDPANIIRTRVVRNQHSDQSIIVDKMKANGYWIIQGEYATAISLSWNATDNMSALTDNIERLSILGYKNGSWTVIASTLENSNSLFEGKKQDLSSGTISTSSDLIPNEFDYFTLGSVRTTTLSNQSNLSVYPNPIRVNEKVTVEYNLDSDSGVLQVISTTGLLLSEQTISNSEGTVSSIDLPNISGTYLVRIVGSNGIAKEKRIVVLGF